MPWEWSSRWLQDHSLITKKCANHPSGVGGNVFYAASLPYWTSSRASSLSKSHSKGLVVSIRLFEASICWEEGPWADRLPGDLHFLIQRQNGYGTLHYESNNQILRHSYRAALEGRFTPFEIYEQRGASSNQCARHDRPRQCRQDKISPQVIFSELRLSRFVVFEANIWLQCTSWCSRCGLHWWVYKCFSSYAHPYIFGLCSICCISRHTGKSAKKGFIRLVDESTREASSIIKSCKSPATPKCLYPLPSAPSPED